MSFRSNSRENDETNAPDGLDDPVIDADRVGTHKTPMERWNNLKHAVVRLRIPQIRTTRSGFDPSGDGLLVTPPYDSARNGGTVWKMVISDNNLDEEGVFGFASNHYTVSDDADSNVEITVLRVGGGAAAAKVYVKTRDTRRGKARAGCDYTAVHEEVVFEPGQYEKTVSVPILGNVGYQGSRSFELVLDTVVDGQLGDHSVATVTILETAVKLYLRLLQSSGFGLLTFIATMYTLVGGNLMLLYLDRKWDALTGTFTLLCISVLLVEMWSLIWLKRLNYLFTTIFFMDLVAITGLVFFIPWFPRISFGFLGVGNASLFTAARAARSASTGSELARNVAAARHVLRAIRRFFRWMWIAVAQILPGKLKTDLEMEVKLDESESEDDMLQQSRSESQAEAEDGKNPREGMKGAKEFVGLFLPSTGSIGINIVEFVIGRLILMMMLLLLIVLGLLRARESSPAVHEGLLALVDQAVLDNSAELNFYLKSYAEYVILQNQRILYLRVQGVEISSETIEVASCNRTRVFLSELGSVRVWWLFVVAPSVPGVNNVTLENEANATYGNCLGYGDKVRNTSLYSCNSDHSKAISSPLSSCGTVAVIDNSAHQKSLVVADLWITLALVGILGVGAAIIASDVHRLFLKPMENLVAVLMLALGSETKSSKARRGSKGKQKREKKAKKDSKSTFKDRRRGNYDSDDDPAATAEVEASGEVEELPAGHSLIPRSFSEASGIERSNSMANIVDASDGEEDFRFLHRPASKMKSSWQVLSALDENSMSLKVPESPELLTLRSKSVSRGYQQLQQQQQKRTISLRMKPRMRWRIRKRRKELENVEITKAWGGASHGGGVGKREDSVVNLICPGSPPWQEFEAAERSKKEGDDSTLLGSLWGRVSRIVDLDVRSLDRHIDKVERAFGWQLIALRQSLRGIVLWNTMADTMAKSMAQSFSKGTLTVAELREKIWLLYKNITLPSWASQSLELQFAARIMAVFGDVVAECATWTEEMVLSMLHSLGVQGESRETVSVKLLTKIVIAVILRYDILGKMEEPMPQGFEEFDHNELGGFILDLCRRKLRQQMESSGVVVPPQFMQVSLFKIWAAMDRIKTHSYYHKLLDAGLLLKPEAATAKTLKDLNRHATTSLKPSLKKILRTYGIDTHGLGLSAPLDTIRTIQANIVLSQVPAVKAAMAAEKAALEQLPSVWDLTMAPLQVSVSQLIRCTRDHIWGEGDSNPDPCPSPGSSPLNLKVFLSSLEEEQKLLVTWQVSSSSCELTPSKSQLALFEASDVDVVTSDLSEASDSCMDRPDAHSSRTGFDLFRKVGTRRFRFSEVKSFVVWTLQAAMDGIQQTGVHISRATMAAAAESAMAPLSDRLEVVVAARAKAYVERAVDMAWVQAGSQAGSSAPPLPFQTLNQFGEWSESTFQTEMRNVLRRYGVLGDQKVPGVSLTLDEELRLGLTDRIGSFPHYVRVVHGLRTSSTEQLQTLLHHLGDPMPLEGRRGDRDALVRESVHRWMGRNLKDRGVQPPANFMALELEQAAIEAETLLVSRAKWQLDCRGLTFLASELEGGGVPAGSTVVGPFEGLYEEAVHAVWHRARSHLQRWIDDIVPGGGELGLLQSASLSFSPGEGIDSLVRHSVDAMMERLEMVLEVIVDPDGLFGEQVPFSKLAACLKWLERDRQLDLSAVSAPELSVMLNEMLDRHVVLGQVPGQLEFECLRNLRARLDALVLHYFLLQMDSEDLSIPHSLQSHQLSEEDMDTSQRPLPFLACTTDLLSELRVSTRKASIETLKTLGVKSEQQWEAMSLEELTGQTFTVLVGSIPEAAQLLDAVALLPPTDGDDLKRFLVKSGYPDSWLPYLPQGAHLPPLDEIKNAPRANLIVMAVQVLVHLSLTQNDKKMRSLFDAIGDMGRAIIYGVHHLIELYKQRESSD